MKRPVQGMVGRHLELAIVRLNFTCCGKEKTQAERAYQGGRDATDKARVPRVAGLQRGMGKRDRKEGMPSQCIGEDQSDGGN